jgi:hypothetical protein
METKVIDNWLDKDLVDHINNKCLFDVPHYWGHNSEKIWDINNKNFFYATNLNHADNLWGFLFYKLKNTLDLNLNLIKMYINIQHQGMHGNFHTDAGDLTCLYMVTKTLQKDSGCFEIQGENKIDFIQNRLIVFDASKEHMGHGPNEKEVRITMVFKSKII